MNGVSPNELRGQMNVAPDNLTAAGWKDLQ